MKKIFSLLLFFCLFSLTACQSNTSTKSESQGVTDPSINNLIQELKSEDVKFKSSQPGSVNSEINKKCHKILFSIINNYSSIGMPANLIVGQESNMYLKISEPVRTGDTWSRIVEYGSREPNMGRSTKVYIQNYENSIVKVTEALEALTNATNIPKIVIAQIFEFKGNYYAVIGEERHGDETRNLYLKTYKYSNNNWEPIQVGNVSNTSLLELKGSNFSEESTFNYERNDTGLYFYIRNKQGSILERRYLDFTGDKPIMRTENSVHSSNGPSIEEDTNVGYLVIGICSQDSQDVLRELELRNQSGFKTYMIYSSDWSNLAPGWYALIYGKYNNAEDANNAANNIKSRGIDVYVKHSGRHK
ncbi:hypothetical protein ACOBQJ_03355 [Pelotomaculum propionicicum]|uniref:hypothetical protein n=1 Tax=Pelotomaculum propionicicum TaxID=258475 RepID=UPI003B794F28